MSLTCNRPAGQLGTAPGFGGQRIGFWSGCQLLINNMVGPALVLIPALFQKYGYLPILSMLLIACLLSFFCGVMLTHVMTAIQSSPHSHIANKRPEMNHIIDYYFTNHNYIKRIIIIVYIASIILTLMSNIIQSAQIIDLAIRDIFGCSYALELYPSFIGIVCGMERGDITPFGTGIYVVSSGFIILAWICLILYTINYNLDDNIYLQWIANIGLIGLSLIWFYIMFGQATFDVGRIEFINNPDEFNADCVGIILFNFAFIVTIPSWYNEKKEGVSVMRSLLYSIVFVVIMFLLIGILGAMSFNSSDLSGANQSLFNVLDDYGGNLGKISVYLYPIIQNITSIPVFCIIIRYNMQNSGLNKYLTNFLSILVPWIISIPLFTGSGFTNLCDFTGICLASFVNFILPPYLYILSIKMTVPSSRNKFFRPSNNNNIAGMISIPTDDKSSYDDDDEDDDIEDDNNNNNTPNNNNVSQKQYDELVEKYDPKTEQIQLIEMNVNNDDDIDDETDDSESCDMDIEKKNQIKCTWDVVVAYCCIVISTILSLVVIIEKIYTSF